MVGFNDFGFGFARLGALAVIFQDVIPIETRRNGLGFGAEPCKSGAISPRLANRYSRFALSYRSCDYGIRRV